MEVLAGIVSRPATKYRRFCSLFGRPAGRATRLRVVIGPLIVVALALAGSPTWAASREEIFQGLVDRYRPAGIELEDPSRLGKVNRAGRVLILALDGVPAKPFRVFRTGGASRAFHHVMEFARIDITPGGSVYMDPGPLRLRKGIQLVLLDVKLKGNDVHLLTHSANPVADGAEPSPVYGCTEFVFRFAPSVIEAGKLEPILQAIEPWLAWSPGELVCSAESNQLCVEP